MTVLSVNVNKIALIRNSRGSDFPNVLRISQEILKYGVHGITIHPRPDERHVKYSDAYELKEALDVELNIEGYPNEKFLDMVCEVKPAQCTLVPDSPDALTSDNGWDCIKHADFLQKVISRLQDCGVRTSIFLNPEPFQVEHAKNTGTDRIELYTHAYCANYNTENRDKVFESFRLTAEAANQVGLGLNAGHDLNQTNLAYFASNLPGLLEVSIGHALWVEMLYEGMEKTIKGYLECLGHL